MATRAAISLVKQKASGEFIQMRCHVKPGASKSREGVVGITDEAIELCVSAPAQDGKANKAVIQILGEALGTPKSDLQITHGLKSRDKTISMSLVSFTRGATGETPDVIKAVRERLTPSTS
ncbi:DUF167-domain-containing protein [Xylariaceae sp. FL0594]|nr:DUF167-domain-containing protein [Xylariaceae sp. FL0594]